MGCNLSSEAPPKKGKGKRALKGSDSSGKKKKKPKGSPDSPAHSNERSKNGDQKVSKKSRGKSPLRPEQSEGAVAAPPTITTTAPSIVVTAAAAQAAPASSQSSSAPYTNPFAPRVESSEQSEVGQPSGIIKFSAAPSDVSSVASPGKPPKKKKKESLSKPEDKWKDERAQGIRRREEVMGEAKLYIVQSWLDMARHELVLQSALPDPQDIRKQVELEAIRTKKLQDSQHQQAEENKRQATEPSTRPADTKGTDGSNGRPLEPIGASSPGIRKRGNGAAMSSELGLKEWNALALAGSYLANGNIVEQLMFSDEEKRKLSGARGGISMDVLGAAGAFFDDSAMTAVQANSERTREDLDSSLSELGP